MKQFVSLLLGLWLATSLTFAQQKEQRVALVIGNSAYKSSPLKNPVNDARDMAASLRSYGFTVIERNNLTVKQIGSTLREFRSKLTPGSVALVFYAGHGLQIKGENYLPAVDADIVGEEDVPNQSLSTRQIMDVLGDAKSRLNLVFLDACRDNPYTRSFRSSSRGLGKENAPSGTLISFATRPGSVAGDGDGKNGLYTSVLLQQIKNTDQPIEQVLKRVVTGVKTASKGQQEPWMEGSIEGDFCFGECGKQIVQSGVSDERVFWDSIKDSRDANEVRAYLEQYPGGVFAGIARARLASIDKSTTLVAAIKPIKPDLLPTPAALTEVRAEGSTKDCTSCSEINVAIAQVKKEVTFGYQDMLLPWRILMDAELEKATGYKINYRMFGGGGAVFKAMSSGDVQIGEIGSSPLATALSQGQDLRLVYILDDMAASDQLVSRNGSGVNSWKDLVGKKVGIPFASTAHYSLVVGMRLEGVDAKSVNVMNLPPPAIAAAWERGDIDAAFIWDPVLSKIKRNGRKIADSGDIGKKGYPTFDGLVVDAKWAAQNRDFVVAAIKAISKADADYRANAAKWTVGSPQVKAIAKWTKADEKDVPEAMKQFDLPDTTTQLSSAWLGGGAAKTLEASAKLWKEIGRITDVKPDYSVFVDTSYLREALKK